MTTPTTNPACIPPTNSRAPLWSRVTLLCPPGLTPAQNKAEVLQYKGNANPLTKKQQLSRIIRGFGPLGNKVWATQNIYGSNPNVFNLEQQGNTLILCPEPTPIIVCPSGIQILDISNVATQEPFFPDIWDLNENITIFKCQDLIIKNDETLYIAQKTLIVEGTITINSGGTIDTEGFSIITINTGGVINNNNGGNINIRNGTYNNFGTINNNTGGTILNEASSIINNNRRINNNGTIYNNNNINSGTINNNMNGTINNTNGGLINISKINNNGIIYNHQNSSINSDNVFNNNIGSIIYNYDLGNFTSNIMFNDGTINSPASNGGCGIGIITISLLGGNTPNTSPTACPPSPP